MHLHILGICGTFMGSLAILARELGYKVTGSDANVYPPMSTQLEEQGIEITQGFSPEQLEPAPDLVIVGNAMSRGNPAVEAVLNKGIPYTSGPQWLSEHVLKDKWVLAVSGTHGKTTTTSMLAQILDYANMAPGFLVGGVPENFGISARLGETPFFVIEADEYDSAFFDKRSKFVHYRPRTLIMNNLEFDHADIFPDLAAIQRQFHHLVRTVPSEGLIVYADCQPLNGVLEQGCWTPTQMIKAHSSKAGWSARMLREDGSRFKVLLDGEDVAEVRWSLSGLHNVANAVAAIAAARHVGVTPEIAAQALAEFRNVKRRMELRGEVDGVKVYDDFAHHPTAINTTLEGAKAQLALDPHLHEGEGRILAVIEPRSNTMRLGTLQSQLIDCTQHADEAFWYQPPGLDWNLGSVVANAPVPSELVGDLEHLIVRLVEASRPGDRIVVMSNGGFGGIHQKLLDALAIKS
ncbi:UDP-N-acetylmuramate:L-alanyl-gamma-D-glutamyl-meso-diaminopimelate ligase [Oceanospirillum sp.]|uniref:UDP-N-acetylmuramate:L-alanyl-gamma-D-glutamyl- meso-diaminopimelate ligase n=1 Tax=Oceanospirillum sp. TaxID=2021254 RepID=UPI003A922A55